jgi:hypothetical protein
MFFFCNLPWIWIKRVNIRFNQSKVVPMIILGQLEGEFSAMIFKFEDMSMKYLHDL